MPSFKDASRTNLFFVNPDELVIVGLDTKHKDGEHFLCDEERNKLPCDPSMVQNVLTFGVKENVEVMKDGTQYLVVFGRQRVKLARAANVILKKEGKEPLRVPVTVFRGSQVEAYGVMAAENAARQKESPLGEARKIQTYIKMGRTEKDAAVAFVCSVATIKNKLALLDLDEAVQKQVQSGELSMMEAIGLRELPKDEQKEAAKKKAQDKKEGKRKTRAKGEKGAAGKFKPTKGYAEAVGQAIGGTAYTTLLWALGEIDDDAACEDKAFKKAFDNTPKRK